MPQSHQKARPYPGRRQYTLEDASRDGKLLQYKCRRCRRSAYYLAQDLAEVYSNHHPVDEPPFPCTNCETVENIKVSARIPDTGDYGHLIIRRPGEVKRTQTWQCVKLGDEVK